MVANGYAIGLLVTHKTSDVLWSTASLNIDQMIFYELAWRERVPVYTFDGLCKCNHCWVKGRNANGNAHAQNRTRCATL